MRYLSAKLRVEPRREWTCLFDRPCKRILRLMARPDRQTKNLELKLARKAAKSRKPGAKAKRWKQALVRVKSAGEADAS